MVSDATYNQLAKGRERALKKLERATGITEGAHFLDGKPVVLDARFYPPPSYWGIMDCGEDFQPIKSTYRRLDDETKSRLRRIRL